LSGCIHSVFNAAKPLTWHSAVRLWTVQWFYVNMWTVLLYWYRFLIRKYCVRQSTTALDWYIVWKSFWIFRVTLGERRTILPNCTSSEIHYFERLKTKNLAMIVLVTSEYF
jgi:hypothetical protein